MKFGPGSHGETVCGVAVEYSKTDCHFYVARAEICINIYIILDGFEGDTRIYCTSYDNIARVEDKCHIVIASAIYYCIPGKKAIQYCYDYLYQAEDLIKALPP